MIQDKNGAEILAGSVLVDFPQFAAGAVWVRREITDYDVVIHGASYDGSLRSVWRDSSGDIYRSDAIWPDDAGYFDCRDYVGNISVIEDFLRALTRHAKGRIAVEPKTDSVFRDSDFAPDPDRIMREKIAKEENAADDEMSLRGAYRRFDRVVRHVLAEEAPHAAIVTDFCSGAVNRPLVVWLDVGGELITCMAGVDDSLDTTRCVFRAKIHEAFRKIGARQMGAKK